MQHPMEREYGNPIAKAPLLIPDVASRSQTSASRPPLGLQAFPLESQQLHDISKSERAVQIILPEQAGNACDH